MKHHIGKMSPHCFQLLTKFVHNCNKNYNLIIFQTIVIYILLKFQRIKIKFLKNLTNAITISQNFNFRFLSIVQNAKF